MELGLRVLDLAKFEAGKGSTFTVGLPHDAPYGTVS